MNTTLLTPSTEQTTTDPSGTVSVHSGPQLVRRAGLPVSRLELSQNQAAKTASALAVARNHLRISGAELGDHLFDLVPQLGQDKALRRAVLALRRNTLRADPPPLELHLLQQLRDAGADQAMLHALEVWNTARTHVGELQESLRDQTTDGIERSTQVLAELRQDPWFLGSVADSSEDFAAHPGRDALSPGTRQARSMLTYAARMARKTSPFGRLTTVGLVGSAPHSAPRAIIDQGYLLAWVDSLARDESTAHLFEYAVLDPAGSDPVREAILVPQVSVHAQFIWKTSEPTNLRELGQTLRRLRSSSGPFTFKQLLALLGGDDPFATLVRYLESGLLFPIAPWSYTEQDRWSRLVNLVSRRAANSTAASALSNIDELFEQYQQAQGSARGRLKADLVHEAESVLATRGVPVDRRQFKVYLDVPTEQVPSALPKSASQALEPMLAELGTRIQRSAAYRHLVQRFCKEFGVGGQCPNSWRWLAAVGLDSSWTAHPATTELPVKTVPTPLGPSMPLPNVAIALQAPERPDAAVVVNQCHAGSGSLAARFTGVLPELRLQLRAWATVLAHGGEPVEFVPSHEVNGLQAVSCGTLRRIARPDDFPLQDTDSSELPLSLTKLVLRHDEHSDSLVLQTPDAVPVVPLYMGIVPSHLLHGIDRVLSVLADPWKMPRPGEPALAHLSDPLQLMHHPRVAQGSLVLRRARWSVPVGQLPELVGTAEQQLEAWTQWRLKHGIPTEVFVKLTRVTPTWSAADRKPLWVDLTSVHCLSLLCALLDEQSSGMVFTEALPDGADLAHTGGHAQEYLLFKAFDLNHLTQGDQ